MFASLGMLAQIFDWHLSLSSGESIPRVEYTEEEIGTWCVCTEIHNQSQKNTARIVFSIQTSHMQLNVCAGEKCIPPSEICTQPMPVVNI